MKKSRRRAGGPPKDGQGPDGKFTDGNGMGLSTRFAPGTSGNPNGAPKMPTLKTLLTMKLNESFEVKDKEGRVIRTMLVREAVIERLVLTLAVGKASLPAIQEIWDREEGPIQKKVEVDSPQLAQLLVMALEARNRRKLEDSGEAR